MKELNGAIKAAVGAGDMIKSRVGKSQSIRYKGEINIVTETDIKAEKLIVRTLKKEFSQYGFLTEESSCKTTKGDRWIIDPLDGTTNFARGFPFFCVSIALEKEGQIIAGVVYDPMHQELFTAIKGKGAYLNKKKIRVSTVKKLNKAFLATGFAYDFKDKKDNNIDNFTKFLMASMAVRRAGAAAIDLCYVACGRFDGFWEMGLQPWDTAAATLIVQEAGGIVTQFDGSPFSNYKKNILASNDSIHKQMQTTLKRYKK
ncbi:MAG: inositol monophosphatase [Candidatus Omnitrophica bacterium]|nr:inositol monophosphatase [Candidatus Omnitrophota bacterium]